MKREAWLGIGFCLYAFLFLAQPGSGGDDLPPDLLHIEHSGCHFDGQVIGVLRVQTKQSEDFRFFDVRGWVRYQDLPGGEKREEWSIPLGTTKQRAVKDDPASIGGLTDAAQICGPWLEKVKQAIVADAHKHGHKVKGDT